MRQRTTNSSVFESQVFDTTPEMTTHPRMSIIESQTNERPKPLTNQPRFDQGSEIGLDSVQTGNLSEFYVTFPTDNNELSFVKKAGMINNNM